MACTRETSLVGNGKTGDVTQSGWCSPSGGALASAASGSEIVRWLMWNLDE